MTKEQLLESLAEARRLLEAKGLNPEEIEALLERLANEFKSAAPENAVAAILDFLRSGEDATTGLGFEVGVGGTLREPPTLRVALLDWLGQMDVAAAESHGREWIDAPRSGDEWAIGLRNIAWSAPDGARSVELKERFLAALRRADWTAAPSDGFLETFDLAPFLGGEDVLAVLTEIHGDPTLRPLAWPALLAVDRMLLADRTGVLSALASNPHWMNNSGRARAGLMARADVRVETERLAVETYLRRADVAHEEAAAFGALYPNQNLIASHRLFTREDGDGRPMPDVAAGDLAAMQRLDAWERDASVSPAFRQTFPIIRARLAEYIESARRAAASGDLLLNQ